MSQRDRLERLEQHFRDEEAPPRFVFAGGPPAHLSYEEARQWLRDEVERAHQRREIVFTLLIDDGPSMQQLSSNPDN